MGFGDRPDELSSAPESKKKRGAVAPRVVRREVANP
jgi:hypothetical protein